MPMRFSSETADRLLASWEEAGLGLFMVQMEMEFTRELSRDRLARSLELLWEAEPVLSSRLVTDSKGLYWEQISPAERGELLVTKDPQEYHDFKIKPPRLRHGPQAMACLFRSGEGDRLLLKVSHQAADAGGTKDASTRLAEIYRILSHNSSYRPDPNLTGLRSGKQVARNLSPWAYPVMVKNFLREAVEGLVPPATHALRFPLQSGNPVYVIRHIPGQRAARVKEYGKSRGATLNDMLVAAYYRALVKVGKWDGLARLRLQITVDLRRYLPEGRAEAVCNLSSYDYVMLGKTLGDDFDQTLSRVTAITRRRKNSYPGLTQVVLAPIMTRMSVPSQKKLFRRFVENGARRGTLPNSITNMGKIKPPAVDFDGPADHAWLLPPVINPPIYGSGLSGYGEGLTLSGGVPESSETVIASLLDQTVAELAF